MEFRMRNFLVLAAMLFLLPIMPCVVTAGGIPVFDGVNLTQNMISALQNIQTVYNQVTQLNNQMTQIKYKLKSLERLGTASYSQLNSLLNGNVQEIGNILGSVNGIGYTLGSIRNQYDAIFPQNTDWKNVPLSDYDDYYSNWNDEVTRSARTSMEAQSVLDRIRSNNEEMINILSQSRNADGEVRQIQASNEMLTIISSQMGDLNRSLASTGRVISTAEAASAAEKRASRRAAELSMEGFTDSKRVEPVYDTPPELK